MQNPVKSIVGGAENFIGFAKRVNRSSSLFDAFQKPEDFVHLKKIDMLVPKLQKFCNALIEQNNARKMRVS